MSQKESEEVVRRSQEESEGIKKEPEGVRGIRRSRKESVGVSPDRRPSRRRRGRGWTPSGAWRRRWRRCRGSPPFKGGWRGSRYERISERDEGEMRKVCERDEGDEREMRKV